MKEIAAGLESLQHEVGGYIQVVYPWAEMCAIVCDEEAKLNDKELNRALRDDNGHIYDIVAGIFLIVGLSENDFTSLEPEHIQRFQALFAVPEVFVAIGRKLLVLPGGGLDG